MHRTNRPQSKPPIKDELSGRQNNNLQVGGERKHRRRKRGWIIRPVVYLGLGGVCFAMYRLRLLATPSSIPRHSGFKKEPFEQENAPLLSSPNECRFDGHCGVGSTCSVARGAQLGTCEEITANLEKPASTICLEACREELEWDEHFYQERWPQLEKTMTVESNGRPDGCMLVYSRKFDKPDEWKDLEFMDRKETWNDVPPSIRKWERDRFHHIKRVDPYKPHDMADNHWMAYCTNPCESDSDCITRADGNVPGFVCREKACQRNNSYWKAASTGPEIVIVTGATSTYFGSLVNLAASVRYWAPGVPMVVYNLRNLQPEEKAQIRSWSNVIALEWESGIPSHLPPHFNSGKKYAWKPHIIKESLEKYESIFWLDAGSTLTGPIAPAIKITQQTGMFLVKGQDTNLNKSSGATYEWFNTTKETVMSNAQGHYSGNTQAYLYPSRYYDSVVVPNAKCAFDPNCITPKGTNLHNHRYDQTSLAIACYHPKVRAPHYTEYLAAEPKQLQSDIKLPSFKFVWTARQGCIFYSKLERNDR